MVDAIADVLHALIVADYAVKMSNARIRVILLLIAALILPLKSIAQQQSRMPRVTLFGLVSPPKEAVDAFRRGMRAFGLEDGRNVVIGIRSADGKSERLNETAIDLVRTNVDIVVALGSDSTRAVQEATRTIPIVTVVGVDPVELGYARTLARPGGNLTGLTSSAAAIAVKQLQIMREILPKAKRLAVLSRAENPTHQGTLRALDTAGSSIGFQVIPVLAHAGALDRAFA